jgi:hypothetical protein
MEEICSLDARHWFIHVTAEVKMNLELLFFFLQLVNSVGILWWLESQGENTGLGKAKPVKKQTTKINRNLVLTLDRKKN